MKKKLLTVFATLMFIQYSVFASSPGITVILPEKNNIEDNQYIITIEIADNIGFAAAQIELVYNKEVVECKKIIPGEVLEGMLIDTNPCAAGEKTSAIISAAGVENIQKSGEVASFVFDKPKNGDPQFEVVQLELTSLNGEKLNCDIKIQNNYGDIAQDKENNKGNNFSENPQSGGGTSGSLSGKNINHTPNTGQIVIHDDPVKVIDSTKAFNDLSSDYWAKEYIDEAVRLGIISGYEDGRFLPDKEMTRAEFATVIWNIAGQPDIQVNLSLNDVTEKDWYYKQTAWAYKNGYISGTTENEFSPNANITREQAMTILYRYNGSPNTEYSLEKFSDCVSVSNYAKSAMSWAVLNNIISGTSETELSPKSNATRAQLATIMVRFLNNK